MENIFLIAGIISVIFFIVKFLEMRYIDNESKPLKILIRDSLVVYVSVVMSSFVIDQLQSIIHENDNSTTPQVFTDNPPF